ncbi:MAG TPA: class I SAM-dependent methyltransferase [Gammaproteobacteria bacterium]|nr:class I SAM-dependent methyltransferase [Gammaproteobacteria bacterium]
MSNRTINLNGELYQYLLDVSVREPGVLRRLREETARLENSNMQIAPEQGRLLALLVQIIGAHRCIEVGVFTGYSSLSVAMALPDDGRIVACDVSEEYTDVARRYWREAGVAHKIDLQLAPALQTLENLIDADEDRQYDFAFIDADKTHYWNYYERVLKLLRPDGLIAIDNTLWSGRVIDPADDSEDTVAIREFNEKLYADERVDLSLVPIGDGLTLARKRIA